MKSYRSIAFALFTMFVLTVGLTGCQSNSGDTKQTNNKSKIDAVAFDFDDTLVFSTPAFEKGYSSDAEPFSKEFWKVVNASDAGNSCVKTSVKKLLEKHRNKGREIYIITAREPHNTGPAKQFAQKKFGVPPAHFFFEPDGKTKRLKKLGVDIYYGDSDSDIKDARKANIKAVRIQRNKNSGYKDKYHPGKYNEKILKGTASHDCSL
ncbi:MAG: HAD family acid phosphatase [bacterium]